MINTLRRQFETKIAIVATKQIKLFLVDYRESGMIEA